MKKKLKVLKDKDNNTIVAFDMDSKDAEHLEVEVENGKFVLSDDEIDENDLEKSDNKLFKK